MLTFIVQGNYSVNLSEHFFPFSLFLIILLFVFLTRGIGSFLVDSAYLPIFSTFTMKLIFYSRFLILRWFTGGGCQRVWHTSAMSAILDLGKAAKPYVSSQSTIDTSGGSTICNYIFLCFSCLGL